VGQPCRLFLPFVPLWRVTSVALVREGDTAYHQARVDRRIDKQTRRVETSQYRRAYHRDLELGTHYFRDAGAGYVLRVASERGWDLHLVGALRAIRAIAARRGQVAPQPGPELIGPGVLTHFQGSDRSSVNAQVRGDMQERSSAGHPAHGGRIAR